MQQYHIPSQTFKSYSQSDGIPLGVYYDVEEFQDHIYLASSNGLIKIPKAEKVNNLIPPNVFIQAVILNQKDSLLVNTTLKKLKYTQNNLAFHLSALSPKSQGTFYDHSTLY